MAYLTWYQTDIIFVYQAKLKHLNVKQIIMLIDI